MSQFSPTIWSNRWKANQDEAFRNSMMDSGWSENVADRCENVSRTLLLELARELRSVAVQPTDLFDRPQLAAVLAAIHEAFPNESPSCESNQESVLVGAAR